jgi:class 3 adenylate cyclase
MTPQEKLAIDTFHKMWEEWSNPALEGIDRALHFYSKDYNGFGSAGSEVWNNIEDMRLFYIRSHLQNPNGYHVQTKWVETRLVDDNYVTLWGELKIEIEQAVKTVVIDPMRITILFRKEGGEMKIVQSHGSLPDVTQADEIWPGTGAPKLYTEASILFTDFVGFTKIMEKTPADVLVNELNEVFAGFDKIAIKNGLEKIKTIGDSYMAAGGLYDQDGGQAVETVTAAKEMLVFLSEYDKKSRMDWLMRVGIHSGPVVGGVIGTDKLRFDLWGETVNRASRIESTSVADKINVSAYTYELIKDVYRCEYRGEIETKDKDLVEMYFVV